MFKLTQRSKGFDLKKEIEMGIENLASSCSTRREQIEREGEGEGASERRFLENLEIEMKDLFVWAFSVWMECVINWFVWPYCPSNKLNSSRPFNCLFLYFPGLCFYEIRISISELMGLENWNPTLTKCKRNFQTYMNDKIEQIKYD